MTIPTFGDANLLEKINRLSDEELDQLPFGVIGFDNTGHITRYNQFESRATGLNQGKQLGRHLFTEVAQCMNNYLVAQRFEDALQGQTRLDVVLDYVLTWRMKPCKVHLRLLADPSSIQSYVVLTPRSALDPQP